MACVTTMDTLQFKGTIIGMILGDGSLSRIEKNRVNSRLSVSSINKDYLYWKLSIMEELTKVRINETLYKKNHPTWKTLYKATSMQHPIYTKLRMRMYHEKGRTIDTHVMKALTPLGVLLWYLDDGSYEEKKTIMAIYSNSYSYSDNMLMAKCMNDNFGLRFNVYQKFSKREGKRYSHLHLAAKDRLKFYEDIIEPFIGQIPSSMMYKVPQKKKLERLHKRMFE
jgi:hypothetical protein